jgi:hypothetical protein
MDLKRWAEWGDVFTDDAEIDTADDAPDARVPGRARIVAFVSSAVGAAGASGSPDSGSSTQGVA